MKTTITMKVSEVSLREDFVIGGDATRLTLSLEPGQQAAVLSALMFMTLPPGVPVPYALGQRVEMVIESVPPAAVPIPSDEAVGLGERFDRDVIQEAPAMSAISL